MKVQPTFKKDLLDRVEVFKIDSTDYNEDYTNVCAILFSFNAVHYQTHITLFFDELGLSSFAKG